MPKELRDLQTYLDIPKDLFTRILTIRNAGRETFKRIFTPENEVYFFHALQSQYKDARQFATMGFCRSEHSAKFGYWTFNTAPKETDGEKIPFFHLPTVLLSVEKAPLARKEILKGDIVAKFCLRLHYEDIPDLGGWLSEDLLCIQSEITKILKENNHLRTVKHHQLR